MIGQYHLRFFLLSVLAALWIVFTGSHLAEARTGWKATYGSSPMSSASTTPRCAAVYDFDLNHFARSTKIDNRFYPLVPGMQYILDGTINAGGGATGHRVVFTVTDLTKVINGVTTRVLWDTDLNGGQLAESELAFQAQDRDGNVWVLGEYPEEYVNGVFIGADSTWISGVQGARPGVLVPGNPQVGTAPFREGYSPKIGFYDCGQVSALNQKVSGYENVLVINEWGPLDPAGGVQQKYYAPGVGLVQIGAINDPEAETMSLTKVKRLSPAGLASARQEALKLEKRAYSISSVYAQTPPMEVAP